MVFSNNLLMGAAGQASGYDIDQSIRFNDGDSAHIARDGFGQSPTSSTVCTISVWVKRGNNLGSNSVIIYGGDPSGSTAESLRFGTGNQLQFSQASSDYDLKTSQIFVDPAAWYHIVAVLNTGAAESSRAALYVNGFKVTDFATENYPGSSYSTNFTANSSSVEHVIGANSTSSQFFDGYIAEFNFIDGQALTPASFGETNSTTGQWVPKKYTGGYGSNGFRLQGSDSSDLGEDTSGNGNDFTSSGMAAADQVKDSPTNNLPTFNPLSSGAGTLSDGNLQYVGTSSWTNTRLNLLVPDTGKWALRFKTASSYDQIMVGLCAPDNDVTYGDLDVNGVAQIRYNTKDGNFVTRVGGSLVADTGPPTTSAQTFFQILFDMDNGKMGVAADGATSGTFADISTYSVMDLNGSSLSTARQPFALVYSGTDANAGAILDAGQSGWETTVTGFKNLTLANLSDPSIADPSKYFQATTYSGNGSSQSIDQAGNSTFEPTMVWIKSRSATTDHVIQDQVRGNFVVYPNQNNADGATGGGWVSSFDSDGFTVSSNAPINDSGETFVGWQWKAGGSSVSNTDGDITSTVRADSTSGVSVLTYSGNGSDNQEIGHGLGVAPKMIITKRRDSSGNWTTYHDAVGINQVFYLNSTAAASSNTEQYRAVPTSSVYTVGVGGDINNSSGTYVAYVFAEIEGFSKFGSFEGNGSTDGPFVYTGFKPRFVMIKRYDSTESWPILDTARGSDDFGSAAGTGGTDPTAGNDLNAVLVASTNAAEEDNPTGSRRASYLSNGFKVRTTNTAMNASGGDYLYMAFAESPFKTATAR
jgi:hypothetical protein